MVLYAYMLSLFTPFSSFLYHLTVTLVGRGHHFLSCLTFFLTSTPKCCKQHHANIYKENHSSNDAVGNLAFDGVGTKLKPEASVNRAKDKESTPIPDMCVCPDRPLVLSLPDRMVNKGEDRLEEKQGDHYDTNNGMRRFDLSKISN